MMFRRKSGRYVIQKDKGKAPDLFARLGANPKPSFQGTSFGREVSVRNAWTELEKARSLAATLSPEDKGSYVMPYTGAAMLPDCYSTAHSSAFNKIGARLPEAREFILSCGPTQKDS